MTDPHVDLLLRDWDPAGADLPDAVVLHLDGCAACRRRFAERFPTAWLPVAPRGRGAAAVAAVLAAAPASARPVPWAVYGALLAAAALALIGVRVLFPGPDAPPAPAESALAALAPAPDPERTWAEFLAASRQFDGVRAREAAAAYLAAAPEGENAELARTAERRLAIVGSPASLTDARWVQGAAPIGGDWIAVLWEVWCRFCLPALRKLDVAASGLPIVALTSASKGTTEDEVRSAAAALRMPVAIAGGPASAALGVGAWPSAVLVCGGVVQWVGGPEELPTAGATPCADAGR